MVEHIHRLERLDGLPKMPAGEQREGDFCAKGGFGVDFAVVMSGSLFSS